MNKFPIHQKTDLCSIAKTFYLRFDAKQFNSEYKKLINLSSDDFIYLGELLPFPLIKGSQPNYVKDGTISVINTLSIQNLHINVDDCRSITQKSFDKLDESRKLKKGDVLLTLDGGTSIGKSALFDMDGNYTVDSHVAILRPSSNISSKALVYLLASPLCQKQFKKMESGASGQTAVTEDDLRRFIIPKRILDNIDSITNILDKKLAEIAQKRQNLDKEEADAWRVITDM